MRSRTTSLCLHSGKFHSQPNRCSFAFPRNRMFSPRCVRPFAGGFESWMPIPGSWTTSSWPVGKRPTQRGENMRFRGKAKEQRFGCEWNLPECKQSDVVRDLTRHHRAQEFVTQRFQILSGICRQRLQSGQPVKDRGSAPFHEPIGEQEQGRTRVQVGGGVDVLAGMSDGPQGGG